MKKVFEHVIDFLPDYQVLIGWLAVSVGAGLGWGVPVGVVLFGALALGLGLMTKITESKGEE